MTSAELTSAPADPLALDERSALARLKQIRADIKTADADTLYATRLWVEALASAARTKRAEELACDAAETQVRLERRLGELPWSKSLDLAPGFRVTCRALAQIPELLFEQTVKGMARRGLKCRGSNVVTNARRASMKPLKPGIWISYDGAYYIMGGSNFKRVRGLSEAESSLGGVNYSKRLDDAHVKARKFALAASELKADLSGDARKKVERAEYLLGEVANLFHEAWRRST